MQVTGMASARLRPRTEARRDVEIEKLLHWAYRDELSKRMTSSAEGIWDRIADFGQRGGIDPGHGAAQRYAHFGLPHPDAETIEKAVSGLRDAFIDWSKEARHILGDLLRLVDPTPDPSIEKGRAATASWPQRGEVRQEAKLEPPRRAILIKTLRTGALVTMHAKMGTKPDWRADSPQPMPIAAARGPNASVIGECRGKNLYSTGSYCPIRWSPSALSIAESRADYLAWWRGLRHLSDVLELESFQALPPVVPEMPWR